MTPAALKFFNPLEEITITGQNLPHWEQAGAAYFLTFRLADALPATLLRTWQHERTQWMLLHPEPWDEATRSEYHKTFPARIDRWLDEGHGSCLLRDTPCRDAIENVLQHDDGQSCFHHAWVIMPNHVHVLFSLKAPTSLPILVGAWKSISARRLTKFRQKRGAVWQRDYFDRLIRDATHFANCVRYIRRNPRKAGLRAGEYSLWESALARSIGEE
jgi:REP element-mobilizing transposase RayT